MFASCLMRQREWRGFLMSENTASCKRYACLLSGIALFYLLFVNCPAAISAPSWKHLCSGKASWYGAKFHGKRTASGKRFDMHKFTCAHRSLPFGTRVLVKNPKTNAQCIVEVIDRGPFHCGRVLDLSLAAAKFLGIHGVSTVNCYTGHAVFIARKRSTGV